MKKWIEAPRFEHSAGCYFGVAEIDGKERVLTSNKRNGPWCAGQAIVIWTGKLWVSL